MQLPIQKLRPFENHPFQVKDDNEMNQLVWSVLTQGVLTPLVVRPLENDEYEVISGHRRLHACQKAGIETVPALIYALDRDAAAIALVDSNLHREKILPSEKAFAYKLKMDALSHQGTSRQLGTKLRTDETIGESVGESARQVQRYIRLTELIPQILSMVDAGKIALTPAVELSYLTQQEQQDLLETMESEDCTPSLSQAIQMKKLSQSGELNMDKIFEILREPKANQQEKISFRVDDLRKYFPKTYSAARIQERILKLLEADCHMLQEDIDLDEVDMMFEEAAESGDEEEVNELKTILYDKNKKGFYVRQRKFEVADMRLLAECVYAAKFIAEGQAKRLVDVVCDFVSDEQAKKIRHNAFLTDRVKTDNKSVMNNIAAINDAMSRHLDGEPHTPEKITFKYLKYSVSDMSKQVERRHGARYMVSPFQLLINDGNYYLLAFDDYSQEMRTYRVDRMKDIRFTGEPRDGEEVFKQIDLKTYTKRVFSMYGGEQRLVEIRFINPLLDAVVDRFGTKDVQYAKVDDTHFSVTAKVEISDQFFGWILGFGKKAKLLYPDDVIDQFRGYMDKIREIY